ncbi:MAG: helix-turn-helix domain-containing protein [Christensenellales bacterium]|jgi:transcriptional regulator with XRE-family HTH domain
MNIVNNRLRMLRESIGYSQMKLAELFGIGQSSIFRYENGGSSAPFNVLIKYADFFDVSLDYIFGRTDNKEGKLYQCKPKIENNPPEMEKFIEMCFDPNSPMNERLKDTLRQMLKEGNY